MVVFASIGQKKNAYGSELGIYVLNTLRPVNKSISFTNGTSYLIERSGASENNFKPVGKYSTPDHVEEFISRAKSFRYPYPTDLNGEELLSAWTAFNKHKSWDSIKKHLSMNYVAAGFGVIFYDSTANKNNNYIYRISIIDPSNKVIETLTTNQVSYPETMTYANPKFYKQTTDGISITSIWQTTDTRLPHHFKVYRSNSETGKFEEYALSKNVYQSKDTIFYAFTDNNVNKVTMYRYVISPSNNYGNYMVKSDTILGTNLLGKDAFLPTHFKADAIDSLNSICLSWKIENPYELDAIEVYRGNDFDGNYEKMISLSANDTSFLDKTVAPGQRYFYTLKVIDRLGRVSIFTNKSFAICNGNTPPAAPVRALSKATDKGVLVYWIPNGENLRGFYIYRCEGIDGEYSQISDFLPFEKSDSVFQYLDKDSTLKLGATYSYVVRQENTGHILGESCSPTIVQPIHLKGKVQMPMVVLSSNTIDKGVLLSWEMKSSVDGVIGLNIFRVKEGDVKPKQMNKVTIDPINQSFIDSSIEKNSKYTYFVSFVNSKGVEVYKTNTVEFFNQDFTLASPYNLRGNKENNQVKLEWESTSENATEFKIYRRIPGQQPVEIGKVNKTTLSFVDSKLSTENVVLYYVVSLNKLGESKPSNEWKLVKE
jgi:hypothetical protein